MIVNRAPGAGLKALARRSLETRALPHLRQYCKAEVDVVEMMFHQ